MAVRARSFNGEASNFQPLSGEVRCGAASDDGNIDMWGYTGGLVPFQPNGGGMVGKIL